MFRVLLVDKRESIHAAVKYLLYRYDVSAAVSAKEAIAVLGAGAVDLVIVDLPFENGVYSAWDGMKELIRGKKTIIITDTLDADIRQEAEDLGAVECIDKLDISRLSDLVGKHLNQSVTRIIDVEQKL